MSAVVMVADAWKPSIVQLVPFANRKIQRHSSLKETRSSLNTSKRCFPILAVTRSQSGLSVDDSVVSLESYQSLTLSDYKSEISDCVPYSERILNGSIKKERGFRKSARHSSMRENRSDTMVKFAVQDLNEQSGAVSPRKNSASSIDTGVSLSTVSANGSYASSVLPKPTLSDKKVLYKPNGLKKSSSFTPGEIELQKQKEKYVNEQAQKRKKYKLNVNQLPRSNTPINDHDPDKLNMKQVIRFLQKQKPSISPRPETQGLKSPEKRSVDSMPKTAPSNFTVGDKIRSDLKTSDSMRSRGSEINIASRSKLVSRNSETSSRTSHSSRYHLSHKHDDKHSQKQESSSVQNGHVHRHDDGHTHENIHYYKHEKGRIHRQESDNITRSSTNKRETKQVEGNRERYLRKSNELGRDRDRNKSSRKHTREFKLHRFLALAPNGEGQKTNPLIISTLAQTRSNNLASMREGLKSEGGEKMRSQSEDMSSTRRVSSERPLPSHYKVQTNQNANNKTESTTDTVGNSVQKGKITTENDKMNNNKTTALMHQRALRYQKMNQKDDVSVADSEDGRLSLTNSSMIRLPSVHDFVEEDDDETYNSSSKSDIEITSTMLGSENDYEQKRETNISRLSIESCRSSVYMPILASSPRKVYSSKSKQSIHVNLPKEDEHETKEIRLSLRQEKDLTAQRSYMHDMASSRSNDQLSAVMNNQLNGQNVTGEKHLFKISQVSMQARKSEDSALQNNVLLSPEAYSTCRSIGAFSIS